MAEPTERPENWLNAVWRFVWRFLLRVAIIALVIFACYRLRNVITTLFVAAIIAYALEWPVDLMCRQRAFIRFHAAIQYLLLRVLRREEEPPPEKVRMHRHTLRVYATLYVLIAAVLILWWGTGF